MNWFKKIFSLVPMVPAIVTGIEAIHGSAINGATKKQMALEALGLAGESAAAILPGDAPFIGLATNLVGNVIDGTVSLFNHQGWPQVAQAGPKPSAPVAEQPAK